MQGSTKIAEVRRRGVGRRRREEVEGDPIEREDREILWGEN